MTNDARLTHLEEALAHQIATLDTLSEVVRQQADQIDRLDRRVALLMRRAAEAEADAATNSVPLSDQKPPHY